MRYGRGIIRVRLRSNTIETEPASVADPATDIRTKSQAVSPKHPLKTDDGDNDETMHDGPENVFAAHQATIEEKQSGDRHHENESRGRQHPCRIALVDLSWGCGGSGSRDRRSARSRDYRATRRRLRHILGESQR